MATQNSNKNGSSASEVLAVEPRPASGGGHRAAAVSPFLDRLRHGNAAPICLLLFGLVVWVFLPATRNDFICFDERWYVIENPHVNSGLSWENVAWAFRSVESSNWHPLTWLSHMLDCQLYGLQPGGHHLTSVLLHGINAVLVFLVLRGMTGATWRSLGVAGLFGLHPLRVESVAWISERKDVLSATFWLLTLWAYGRYVKGVTSDKWRVTRGVPITSPSVVSPATCHPSPFYGLALLFFALGLMSKAMVVTLPFALLLLDYWPLGRVLNPGSGVASLKTEIPSSSTLNRLLLEKAPFFLLAAAAGVVTYSAQKGGGMMKEWAELPLGARMENALVSYARYLGKLFWPADLCAFYPHPGYWPAGTLFLAGLLVFGVSVLALVAGRRRPYLLVGWFWYVGTLAPVIGLVQIGGQSMADRYTYLPTIGVVIVLVWGAYELTRSWRYQAISLSATGAMVIVACIGLTRHQIGYWKDSVTAWSHAVAITQNNYDAHSSLGYILLWQDRLDEAISQYREAIRLKPDFAEAQNNLGDALLREGQADEAFVHFQKAVEAEPDYAMAHNNLGYVLLGKDAVDEALTRFQRALELQPDLAEAHINLAYALLQKGRADEALAHYRNALQVRPAFAEAHNGIGVVFLKTGRVDEAIREFREALWLRPNYALPRSNLALAFRIKRTPAKQPVPPTEP